MILQKLDTNAREVNRNILANAVAELGEASSKEIAAKLEKRIGFVHQYIIGCVNVGLLKRRLSPTSKGYLYRVRQENEPKQRI